MIRGVHLVGELWESVLFFSCSFYKESRYIYSFVHIVYVFIHTSFMFSAFSLHLNLCCFARSVLLQFDSPDNTILVQLPPMHLSCVFVFLNRMFHDSCICLVDFNSKLNNSKLNNSQSESTVAAKPG